MLISGSISKYVKSMSLEIKARQKIQEQTDPLKKQLLEQVQEDKVKMQMASIRGKLQTGKKLSSEELDFLREKSPDLYKKAVEAEQARRDYERRLRNCKTKEDVQRLNASVNLEFVSQVKAIKGSNMSKSAKTAAMQTIQMKQAAMQDSHVTFVASADYAQLPTEKEDEERRKKSKKKGDSVDINEVLPKKEDPKKLQEMLDKLEKAEQKENQDAQTATADKADTPDAPDMPEAPDTSAPAPVASDTASPSTPGTPITTAPPAAVYRAVAAQPHTASQAHTSVASGTSIDAKA